MKVLAVVVFYIGWSILKQTYDESVCQSIKEFIEIVKKDPNTLEKCQLSSLSDKDTRKRIHQVIREAFPLLVSDTNDDCIVLHSCKNQSYCFNWSSL